MRRTSRRRSGFTLTEILMAVGILGVGLTMVATIFPVAVDQSRRSTDLTMASLCARSTAAQMRVRRVAMMNSVRANTTTDKRPLLALDRTSPALAAPVAPAATAAIFLGNTHRIYNPSSFLYEQLRTYDNVALWRGGNYVAVPYVTPIGTSTTGFPAISGPFRVTLVVFKSNGMIRSEAAAPNNSGPRLDKGHLFRTTVGTSTVEPNRIGGGDYAIDANANRGEGYLIDLTDALTGKVFTVLPKSQPGTILTGTAATGVPTTTAGIVTTDPVPTANGWYALQTPVIVFHTIVGD